LKKNYPHFGCTSNQRLKRSHWTIEIGTSSIFDTFSTFYHVDKYIKCFQIKRKITENIERIKNGALIRKSDQLQLLFKTVSSAVH
jgi:hypothetical protein